MLDAEETVIGANGSVLVAPVGTVVPATPIAVPASGWKDIGYLNEDGLQITDGKEINSFMAWQSYYPIRKVMGSKSFMVAITMLQWNLNTLPLALGGGTVVETGVGTGVFEFEPEAPGVIDERALLVRWQDGDKNYQLAISRGIVNGDVEFSVARTSLSELPIVFEALNTAGTAPYSLITDDPAFDATP